jgi:hypothetical protein
MTMPGMHDINIMWFVFVVLYADALCVFSQKMI